MKRLILLALLQSVASNAELGPELQYLADTPVSRLEYGLGLWQTDIDKWVGSLEVFGGPWAKDAQLYVGIDPDKGTVYFVGILTAAYSSDVEENCEKFMSLVRDRFGKRLYGYPLNKYFGHRFMDPPPPTEDMINTIGRSVLLTCNIGSFSQSVHLVEEDDE